jgi:hypothetical protein
MPIPEEAAPWAVSKAAAREPYPRKNLYFVGEYMDEIYDYCIWRANIDGYTKLDGSPARGSSDFITDQLARAYLRTMLDADKAKAFAEWRRQRYAEGGKDATSAQLHPNGIILAKSLGKAATDSPVIYVPAEDSFALAALATRKAKRPKAPRGKNTSTR